MSKDLTGKRVIATESYSSNRRIINEMGTVIDGIPNAFDEVLVQFDNNIHGHNGNGVGNVVGKHGHCWWIDIEKLRFVNEKLRVN